MSESARRSSRSRLRIPAAKLAVVPEAPDPVFWPRSRPEIDRVLDPLGIPAGTRYLLNAGGVSPHKNVETLLDAFASLRSTAPALKLVVAGALDDETYLSSAGSVRARIAELGLGDDVVLPGFVPDEALACLYSGAAAVVLPSLAEGFGLPAVEGAGAPAGRAQRHPRAPRDARRRGALLPAARCGRPRGSPSAAARLGHAPAVARPNAAIRRAAVRLAADAQRRLVHEVPRRERSVAEPLSFCLVDDLLPAVTTSGGRDACLPAHERARRGRGTA